jgi:hypothetical protein
MLPETVKNNALISMQGGGGKIGTLLLKLAKMKSRIIS